MLEIKNTEVFGLERSLQASGNPHSIGDIDTSTRNYALIGKEHTGNSDFKRGKSLGKSPIGSGHDNFLSGIDVYYDVKYSMYWSMEFQRYHFNQIISSQSKMHKLTSMATSDEFPTMFNKYVEQNLIDKIKSFIEEYNNCDQHAGEDKYFWFMKILSNLPMGFEMWMTVRTNFLQLKTMYNQRNTHKLKEDWGPFCEWCWNLPMFRQLTGVN